MKGKEGFQEFLDELLAMEADSVRRTLLAFHEDFDSRPIALGFYAPLSNRLADLIVHKEPSRTYRRNRRYGSQPFSSGRILREF